MGFFNKSQWVLYREQGLGLELWRSEVVANWMVVLRIQQVS